MRSRTESKMVLRMTGRMVPLLGSTSNRLPVTWARDRWLVRLNISYMSSVTGFRLNPAAG